MSPNHFVPKAKGNGALKVKGATVFWGVLRSSATFPVAKGF
jgi:hypothetical protein